MKVASFDFDLPKDLIAQRPVVPRDASRLLHIGESLSDRVMRDLPHLLSPNDILVINDTKVFPSRLSGVRGQAKIQITLHKQKSELTWFAFARGSKRIKIGDEIKFGDGFFGVIDDKLENGEVVISFVSAKADLMKQLNSYGSMPVPPYIKRTSMENYDDRVNYQTIFANKSGAVAAPTAGLHFTDKLIDDIKAVGIKVALLTLHVGAGTFLPVKSEDTEDHKMHSEWGQIDPNTAEAINKARASGGKVVAVGTTSVRLLETAAENSGEIHSYSGETNIFITPGYNFKIVDMMLTNFHLPKSTLFMLVNAFAGTDKMKSAYDHAIKESYRFFSYGDATLIERSP